MSYSQCGGRKELELEWVFNGVFYLLLTTPRCLRGPTTSNEHLCFCRAWPSRMMLLALYTCLFWLSTSGLWTIQAKDSDAVVSKRNPHRDLAPSNTDFAFTLYKHLVASAPGRNVFISPVSISTALAMLSLGASGYTRKQLLHSLGFNLTETSEAEIHQGFRHVHHLLRESDTALDMAMGNALFLDCSLELLDSFSEDTKHYYGLDALATDFQDWTGARRQINEYVKNKTRGKIVDLFSELDSSAMLILVNYIFFKGTLHPSHSDKALSSTVNNSKSHQNPGCTLGQRLQSYKAPAHLNLHLLHDPIRKMELCHLTKNQNDTQKS